MKVSIITLHRVFNYGSILQSYATQEILKNYCDTVEIIDYVSTPRTLWAIFISGPYKGKKISIKKIIYYLLKFPSICLKSLTFTPFKHKYLNLSKKKYITTADLDNDPPVADIYVSGSDQIWNSNYNGGIDGAYYLKFAPEKSIKIAFCSSFGSKDIEINDKDIVKNYLYRYDAISVREKSGVDIISSMGIKDVSWIIDPTLQVANSQWKKLSSKRLVKEPYLLLFLPYTENNCAHQIASTIAKKKGLKVVGLSWNINRSYHYDKLFLYATPPMFLSLIQYAEYIVTNSFHGIAFSINFEKQFVAVKRDFFNERIESLLKLTCLSERLISTVNEALIADATIDYRKVDYILDNERMRASTYINTSLRNT